MKHNLLISREGYGSDIMVEIPEYLAKEITSDFSRFRISGVCVELENVENVVNRIPYAAIKECINLWNNGTGKIDAINDGLLLCKLSSTKRQQIVNSILY